MVLRFGPFQCIKYFHYVINYSHIVIILQTMLYRIRIILPHWASVPYSAVNNLYLSLIYFKMIACVYQMGSGTCSCSSNTSAINNILKIQL